MITITPRNKRISLSSKFFRRVPENQNNIEKIADDNTKISANNFGDIKEPPLSLDHGIIQHTFQKQDKNGMVRNTLMMSADLEHLEIDRMKSSFETPSPCDSTSCYRYEKCDEYVESFIPIAKDHIPFATFDSNFEKERNKDNLVEFRHLLYRSSSRPPSYNQSDTPLPQSLLIPIL